MTRVARASLVLCTTALAVFLRFDALGTPSYWLDEILGQIVARDAATMAPWRWLTGFHPQHGPLYYALELVAGLASDSEWSGRFFAALFGTLTIALLWFVARRLTRDSAIATAAALLLAVSPLHVYASREARPYALVMALATAFLLAIVTRSRRAAIALLVLMLYTSIAAATVVAAGMLASLIAAQLQRDPEARRDQRFIALAAAITLPLFALLYRGTSVDTSGAPFSGIGFDRLVRGLAVTALDAPERGRTAYVVFALAVIGAIVLFRRDRAAGAAVVAMAVLPIAINVTSLALANHFFAIRYVTPALPAYLLLAAAAFALRPRVAWLAIPVALAIAWQCWPAARREPLQKLDWRTIAATLARYAKPGDTVVAAEAWSKVSLGYYLARTPHAPPIVQIPYPDVADIYVRTHRGTWLVTAGSSADTRMRQWICRWPMVLAGRYEDFRMHYAGDFFRERGGIAEQRALAYAMGSRARLSLDELGDGWADAEGTFRWAIGTRATLSLPRFGAHDRVIRMWMLPYRPPQRVRVLVNGAVAGELDPPDTWSERRIVVPARFWRDGMNEIAFAFAHAIAPADVERSNDHRQLAACFEWISVDDVGASERALPRVRPVGIASVILNAPAEPSKKLSIRGFDPMLRVDPMTAAESVAWGSDCEDPHAFVRRVFAMLLDREPSPEEERSLLQEQSRVRLVRRIIRGREFRERLR